MLSFLSTLFVFIPISFADPNIAPDANSADCKNSTLETYSGTSNLTADWEANTIHLRWYNNNTLMRSNTCVYDGGLTIPNAPTRTGYTFTGWRVRPHYDFSTIPVSGNAITARGRGVENKCFNNNSAGIVSCANDTELSNLEWYINFSHGTVYGMAKCSVTDTADSVPENTYGGSCWCKATGYKLNDGDTVYGPSKALPWVLAYNDTYGNCATYCVYRCIHHLGYVIDSEPKRQKLFGITQ